MKVSGKCPKCGSLHLAKGARAIDYDGDSQLTLEVAAASHPPGNVIFHLLIKLFFKEEKHEGIQ